MRINVVKIVAFGVVSCGAIATTVVVNQMRKHGGHITIGIGSRELSWYIDPRRKEVGEG